MHRGCVLRPCDDESLHAAERSLEARALVGLACVHRLIAIGLCRVGRRVADDALAVDPRTAYPSLPTTRRLAVLHHESFTALWALVSLGSHGASLTALTRNGPGFNSYPKEGERADLHRPSPRASAATSQPALAARQTARATLD